MNTVTILLVKVFLPEVTMGYVHPAGGIGYSEIAYKSEGVSSYSSSVPLGFDVALTWSKSNERTCRYQAVCRPHQFWSKFGIGNTHTTNSDNTSFNILNNAFELACIMVTEWLVGPIRRQKAPPR